MCSVLLSPTKTIAIYGGE